MSKKPSFIMQNKLLEDEVKPYLFKDGYYIKYRKRTYLYWFKFLQEAEKSSDNKVSWSKYKGWGSSNEVLGSKFDDWWESNWKSLFGFRLGESPKFAPDVMGKTFRLQNNTFEDLRMSYLIYMLRDTPSEYRRKAHIRFHGRGMKSKKSSFWKGSKQRNRKQVEYKPLEERNNYLSIAYRLYNSEKPKMRVSPIAHLNPDDEDNKHSEIQVQIRNLLDLSETTLKQVSMGLYP